MKEQPQNQASGASDSARLFCTQISPAAGAAGAGLMQSRTRKTSMYCASHASYTKANCRAQSAYKNQPNERKGNNMKLKVNWKELMKQLWTAEVKVLDEGERMNFAPGKISPQREIPLFTFAFNLRLI